MEKLGRKLFLFSLIFALIASGLVYIYLKSLNEAPEEAVKQKTILVAAVNIPPRTLITKEMVKEVSIPEDAAFGNFVTDGTIIIGKYTKDAIYENEQFLEAKLISDTNIELSALIHGDHRAITIALNQENGVANLILPGDYVDIIIFMPELKENDRIVRPNIEKLLLQNVEVLAMDQKMERADRATASADAASGTFYATLSVPVVDVERLALAEDLGSLELVLRPIDKDYIYKTNGVVWEELLLDESGEMKDLFPQYDIAADTDQTASEATEGNDAAAGEAANSSDVNTDTYDKYTYYTIQYGDTLRSISQDFYGDELKYTLIQKVNRIDDEDDIVSGTGIKIPVLDQAGE